MTETGEAGLEHLEITTFGTTGVRVGDRDIPALSGTKLGLLLTYLAAEGPRRIPREELAERFWPELDTESARVNLRQALFQLRRHLAPVTPAPLHATVRYVQFQPPPSARIDFLELDQALAAGSEPDNDAGHALEILRAWRGQFLESMPLAAQLPGLADWLEARRAAAWSGLLGLLERHLPDVGQTDHGEALLGEFQRLHATAPDDPQLNRLLMLALAASGAADQALEHYAELEARITPGPQLARTRDEILSRRAEHDDGASGGYPAATATPALRPERRRVTVVACHVTPDERLDVELQHQQMESTLAQLDLVMLNQRGHVVRAPGFGLLAYFGYPAGREEATLDAVRAAWEALQRTPGDRPLRLAVDTGLIITGTEADLPDPAGLLTARAQDMARGAGPRSLVVSSAVHARIAGYFTVQGHDTAGTATYRVTGHPGPRDRLDAQQARGLAPFTGRTRELGLLRRQWNAAISERRPRFLLIQGEAGLGKSRLARRLDCEVRQQTRSRFHLKCHEERSRHLLAPVRQALAAWLGTGRMAPARLRRLAAALEGPEITAQQALDLARWLTRPDAGADGVLPDRDAIIDRLADLVGARARHAPVLLICDDVHWMDSGTAEFLRRLHQRLPDRPLLVILTARMSFRSRWRDLTLEHLRLHRLDDVDANALVTQLDPGRRLSTRRRRQLVRRGEGVPLFLEELVHHALEHLRESDPELTALPPGLSNFLVARLEQLGPARELAHTAAVIGREFDTDTLARLTGQSADTLRPQLDHLVGKGFVEPVGLLEGVRYRFRHDLFRQAAYESMLLGERARLHGALAGMLREDATQSGDPADLGCLATHLQRAGRHPEAVAAWLEAGENALGRSMLVEAARHFEDALACLDAEPPEALRDLDRRPTMLRALVGHGTACMPLRGHGTRDVTTAFKRALRIDAIEQDPVLHFRALWGLWHGTGAPHSLDDPQRLAAEMAQLAEASGDRLLTIASHYVQGTMHFRAGRLTDALEHLTRAITLYRPEDHPELIARHPENPAIAAHGVMTWTHLLLGDHAAAWAEMDTVCDRTRNLRHQPTEALATTFRAILAFLADEPKEVLPAARRARSIADTGDYPLWRAASMTLEHWALTRQGDRDALEPVRTQAVTTGELMSGLQPLFQLVLLDALRARGEAPEPRLAVADKALAAAEAQGGSGFAPALRRQRAEALLERSNGRDPEGWKELERARQQAHAQGNPNVERQVCLDHTRFGGTGRVQAEDELRRIDRCIIPRDGASGPRDCVPGPA